MFIFDGFSPIWKWEAVYKVRKKGEQIVKSDL